MHSFERMLIDKGFKKFFYNAKTGKNEPTDKHVISSMVNLGYIYIKGDKEICFGLSEIHKPPTLIHPRPRIRVTREIEKGGHSFIAEETEVMDNSMNIVLEEEDNELILESLFDSEIRFEYDLTTTT